MQRDMFGAEVIDDGNGMYRVASQSHPGTYHVVDGEECDCPGYHNRLRCRHIDMVRQFQRDAFIERAMGPIEWADSIDPSIPIYTARYSCKQLRNGGITPVRTSLGEPRFRLFYDLVEREMDLAPHGILGLSVEEYVPNYEQLVGPKLTDVLRRLDALVDRYRQPVAILCFEDLKRPGEFCHRRIFARMAQERTGRIIPELS